MSKLPYSCPGRCHPCSRPIVATAPEDVNWPQHWIASTGQHLISMGTKQRAYTTRRVCGGVELRGEGGKKMSKLPHRHVLHHQVLRVLQVDGPVRAVLRGEALEHHPGAIVEVDQAGPALATGLSHQTLVDCTRLHPPISMQRAWTLLLPSPLPVTCPTQHCCTRLHPPISMQRAWTLSQDALPSPLPVTCPTQHCCTVPTP